MTTLPTLTTYAADACDARIPPEFVSSAVLLTLERHKLTDSALRDFEAWLDAFIDNRHITVDPFVDDDYATYAQGHA